MTPKMEAQDFLVLIRKGIPLTTGIAVIGEGRLESNALKPLLGHWIPAPPTTPKRKRKTNEADK